MKRKNIVTIGGGTGSFMLLSGLKNYPVNISAIVSMADDGGSTGVLRDELGVLPPGDVRQCLIALSNSSDIMRQLMSYRFGGNRLKGHSFGNLLLSALEKIKGNFVDGVEEAAKILQVKGEVIPVTEDQMRLVIKLKNGRMLKGEAHLDHSKEMRRVGVADIYLESKVGANRRAVGRIKKADLIIIGPGDYYGSTLPNLLVKEISDAVRKSRAKVIYVCNLTNKKGQTDGFSLERYISEIEKFIGCDRINFVVFNGKKPRRDFIKRYESQEGKGAVVEFKDRKRSRRYRVIVADLLSSIQGERKDTSVNVHTLIRHDSDKLARVIMTIAEWEDGRSLIKEIL
ncbi:MAG: hypothetical protein CO002_00235 [Candidatus Portnoybacteria bacterium CG_4_8_14_3_um_filter_44_10]|uniref:Putative gluconeogenesis factor n=4 Tax=Candidatus Portnoyibacteriota TaxID=1817913 RepID=A0A2H0KRJ2_9BACT|nr:MAG: hypothetical protein AUK17_03840 [Parcubacteria group bacterium CG2_30_44_18]PIQ74756.1 MAG: hypothetical protein COV85_00365 [Candidatus Portnoybacteria bacterium CG11_big_fil_rev_8_21_14_0_20_44_10]PIS16163.1 MAG: hypothetical protein COT61_05345 [Candidatus Portnoybacteria bacterium CG09_land_8_20_14_0_10_44_13]PIW75768.1 MAG: hypothetical protein CO002_00235 [Candidatus Portnoybacteria bacterium CG_4_8_14_3_um_filter_44_10]PJA63051.1 MAG: hypothetical protein CO161_03100 [Candidatus